MNQSNRSPYIIAGAVVFAGLIIAAGIFFGDTGNQSDSQPAETANQQESSAGDSLVDMAVTAGVDKKKFQSCLDSEKFQSAVRSDTQDARSSGGQGTPYNVVILNDPLSEQTKSRINNQLSSINVSDDGLRLSASGALPYDAMKQLIDTLLADPESGGSVSESSDLGINSVTEDDYVRGSRDAAVTVVEYSDFECPYCQRFHQTMKRVIDNYESDEVAWVFRQFPIPQLHPKAPRIARASECVADLGGDEAFWTFADEVFKG